MGRYNVLSRRELFKALGFSAAAAALPLSAIAAPEPEPKSDGTLWKTATFESGEVEMPRDAMPRGEVHREEQTLGKSTIIFKNTETGDKTTFECVEANLDITERQNYDFVQWDAGNQPQLRLHEQEPIDICIDFVYEYVSGGKNWHKDIRGNKPGDMDVVFETEYEQIRLPEFVWDSMEYDLYEGRASISGRCMGKPCHTKS